MRATDSRGREKIYVFTKLLPAILTCCLQLGRCQDAQQPPQPVPERWNLYYQATSIGQDHGTFNAPYQGPLSLQDDPERDVSLTTTLFFGLRLGHNTQLYFDPEIAGGRGFSGVNGIANAPNGELPRVAGATPKPYIARLYISHDFGFGDAREHVESDDNQLAGERPMTRYTISVGRFSLTDFFDNNRYTHDPRTQFMAWGVMYNGAWDYPADTRGYTWGMVHEFHTRNWSLRYGSAAEPRMANGLRFDRRLFRDRGDVFEGERRYSLGDHPGAIRLLGYLNHTDSGSYGGCAATGRANRNHAGRHCRAPPGNAEVRNRREPRAGDHRRCRRLRAAGLERRQDRGLRVHGHRPAGDRRRLGQRNPLEAKRRCRRHIVHRQRPFRRARALPRARRARLPDRRRQSSTTRRNTCGKATTARGWLPGFFATFDLQHVANPAYNHDRGPVWIESIRLHMEFGLRPLQAK